MMHAEEVEFYKAPDVPTPQVQLEMPNQKSVRTVVDRMKSKQCKDHFFLPFAVIILHNIDTVFLG
jgi:Hus1-like protein